jgi:GH24 family phage-related lysozyme (muramidase)
MKIVESILTQNKCYTSGKKIEVKGLMLHSVGCSQPSADVFVKSWNKPEQDRACVHAFIDGNTGTVYQTLPWNHRAWHCGDKGNNTHIGVEMCEPSCISYQKGGGFTCNNREAAMEVVKRTYDTAVELFAYLCKMYNLNPLEDGVIISHKEGHDRKIASGHGDPEHLWNGMGCGYTMDGFRQAVAEMMKHINTEEVTKETTKETTKEITKETTEKPKEKSDAAKQTVPMTISDEGVEFVARYEGCKLNAYLCPAGVWTIGYGHTAGVKSGDTLPSEDEAKALLKDDLKKYAGYVNKCVEKKLITFPLNQNQFDALTSFCYNCGLKNLETLVTDRDEQTVAEKLLLYVKGGGKVLPGLEKRRKEERELFLKRG